ncbi:branched-chain amino acid ABC transporter permease [Bradyrhizobium sp. NAS80.1]|uniref:branched-chain amino acid ABC transporter permease n=1 Tax=Bradyrhizobium sp. NAS80.1 TaxID=1680159 RepID=UPI00095FDEE1|nr:branched-chain amino acid ABC transporter permease [Bradyrhizobium sp. NAS80.1]OKO86277.1 branched-chain amino acid ABC transporter permease [Bradyrhizobium sp. NAS80.1]
MELMFAGLALGGLYALLAMGLTLQYGVARILNLAYGIFVIAAAFGAYVAKVQLGISPIVALLFSLPLGFGLGWALYSLLLLPLVRRTRAGPQLDIDSLLATFGLMFVIEGALLWIFGGNFYSYSYLSHPVYIAGTPVEANRLVVILVALALTLLLHVGMNRTRLGLAVRAVEVDPATAVLAGIDARTISALVFGVGGAVVAVSGVIISMFLPFSVSMATEFLMKALLVVVMGGLGSISGCLLAGMTLGFGETIVARFIDPGLTLAVNFGLFIVVLSVRPAGIFGRTV